MKRNNIHFILWFLYNLKAPPFLRYCLRTFYKNSPIIFFCHRVLPSQKNFSLLDEFYYRLGHPTKDEFYEQVQYLSKYHSIVSINDVVDYVVKARDLPKNPVAITFDDGYYDNYSHARPVLDAFKCSASFFITTRFIDERAIPFHDRIIYGLCYTDKKTLRLNTRDKTFVNFPLTSLNEKLLSFGRIQDIFKRLPYEDRELFVSQLLDNLEISVDQSFSKDFMLSWSQIKEMRSQGHSFYSHSVSHPLLVTLAPVELQKEILKSNRTLISNLAVKGDIFCYPYGKEGEFNSAVIDILKGHNFRAAFTALHGLNLPGDDPYRIKRTAMISEPLETFALRASGLLEILNELLLKCPKF